MLVLERRKGSEQSPRIYLVLQGEGFKESIQRSVVTGLNFTRARSL